MISNHTANTLQFFCCSDSLCSLWGGCHLGSPAKLSKSDSALPDKSLPICMIGTTGPESFSKLPIAVEKTLTNLCLRRQLAPERMWRFYHRSPPREPVHSRYPAHGHVACRHAFISCPNQTMPCERACKRRSSRRRFG